MFGACARTHHCPYSTRTTSHHRTCCTRLDDFEPGANKLSSLSTNVSRSMTEASIWADVSWIAAYHVLDESRRMDIKQGCASNFVRNLETQFDEWIQYERQRPPWRWCCCQISKYAFLVDYFSSIELLDALKIFEGVDVHICNLIFVHQVAWWTGVGPKCASVRQALESACCCTNGAQFHAVWKDRGQEESIGNSLS